MIHIFKFKKKILVLFVRIRIDWKWNLRYNLYIVLNLRILTLFSKSINEDNFSNNDVSILISVLINSLFCRLTASKQDKVLYMYQDDRKIHISSSRVCTRYRYSRLESSTKLMTEHFLSSANISSFNCFQIIFWNMGLVLGKALSFLDLLRHLI